MIVSKLINIYIVSDPGRKKRTGSQSAYNPHTTNAGVYNRDNISELALEGGVEVCATLDSN